MKKGAKTQNILKKIILQSRYYEMLCKIKKEAGVFEDERRLEKEVYGQIKKIIYFTLIISGFIVVFLFQWKKEEGIIRSGSVEKEQQEMEYEIYYEAEEGKVSGSTKLVVPQKNYEEEEVKEMFEKVKKRIDTEILNGNESLEKVNKDLYFMDYFEEYPVEIFWSTENEDLINGYGEVFNSALSEECRVVIVHAELLLGEYQEEYCFPVCVIPSIEKDALWWQRAVTKKLENILEKAKEENVIILPQDIDGEKIVFKERESRRPWELLLLIPVIFAVFIYGNVKDAEKLKKIKEEELIREYPELLSRISLYIQAGMTSRTALGKIVSDYQGEEKEKEKKYGYEEMEKTFYEMNRGVSEHEAYKNMGERIGLAEYKKLSTILIQQLEKGSKGFLDSLQEETREAFEKKKRIAKEAGEKAGTKMLIPMGILFVITLVIIMTPACMSFGF